MIEKRKMNVALVCTKGGHFEQMTNLSELYLSYDHFWITTRNKQTESQLQEDKAYFIEMAHFKKPWTYLSQIMPVLKAFAIEKPTHILSTGSGRTALIPYLLARITNIRFIHIDTFSRVHGYSKFGSFVLRMGDEICTQWEDPENSKAIYIGPVFKHEAQVKKNVESNYIFVTLGTREEPFTRLMQAVEDLARKGKITEKIIVQAGYTKFTSDCMEVFDFCSSEKINELILNARYVITQESAGIGTQCLKCETKFIVMPRDYRYGELPTRSDMKEDLHYKLAELGYTKVVTNISELEVAIDGITNLKTGFNFNNNLAISTLRKIMEVSNEHECAICRSESAV
jgi:UDP-N-acetylglucosamine transferase subunit ALG13